VNVKRPEVLYIKNKCVNDLQGMIFKHSAHLEPFELSVPSLVQGLMVRSGHRRIIGWKKCGLGSIGPPFYPLQPLYAVASRLPSNPKRVSWRIFGPHLPTLSLSLSLSSIANPQNLRVDNLDNGSPICLLPQCFGS
jgi:hypothetical protein